MGSRRLVALAAAALGLAAVLTAGCSRPGESSRRGAGSTIRFNIAADPTNLNPLFLHQDASSVEQQLARLVFEPFFDLDERGRAVPALATDVPTSANGGVSADGRTIVYHLRRSARWSDGVPVTAEDVLYTLRAILDPRNPVASREGYDLIDHATARGPHTVIFHLRRAWAPAVATLFSYGFRPQFVLPAHVLRAQEPLERAAFNSEPAVGDGPYEFVSWHRGESLSYRPNPRYWGEHAAQPLDVRIVTEPSTNLVMLGSDQLDWNLVAPSQAATLSNRRSLRFDVVPTSVVAGIVMNLRHPPLDDVRIRRALAMLVDRRAISDKITLRRYPVTDMLEPQFSWAYDPRVREPAYDPKAADALLDAAGWRPENGVRQKNGKRLALVYVQFPESSTGVRVATAVQAMLHAHGVDVTVKSISNAQLFLPESRGGTLAGGNFDLAYVPFTMGADPDDSSVLRCDAAANYMRYCNREVDALERRAITASSQDERRALYARIAGLVAQDVPILYLFNARYVYAYRSALHGFAPNAFLPTWNAARWRLR